MDIGEHGYEVVNFIDVGVIFGSLDEEDLAIKKRNTLIYKVIGILFIVTCVIHIDSFLFSLFSIATAITCIVFLVKNILIRPKYSVVPEDVSWEFHEDMLIESRKNTARDELLNCEDRVATICKIFYNEIESITLEENTRILEIKYYNAKFEQYALVNGTINVDPLQNAKDYDGSLKYNLYKYQSDEDAEELMIKLYRATGVEVKKINVPVNTPVRHR